MLASDNSPGLGQSCARAELGVFVAVLWGGGLRFGHLVPHRGTTRSRSLNTETFDAPLLVEAGITGHPTSTFPDVSGPPMGAWMIDKAPRKLLASTRFQQKPGFPVRQLEKK